MGGREQPSPAPTGPEHPRSLLGVPTAVSGSGSFEPCEQGVPCLFSVPSPGLAPLALGPGLAPSHPPGACVGPGLDALGHVGPICHLALCSSPSQAFSWSVGSTTWSPLCTLL